MSLVGQTATKRTVLIGAQADAQTESADYRIVGRPMDGAEPTAAYAMLESQDTSTLFSPLKQQGGEEPEWSVEFEVENWNHLYWVFGGTADVDQTTYQEHTITAEVTVPYISAEFTGQQDSSDVFTGSAITNYQLRMVQNAIIEASMDAIALAHLRDATPATVTSATLDNFTFSGSSFTIDSVEYKNVVRSATLTITRDITRGPIQGQTSAQYLNFGRISAISLEVELDLPDENLWTLIKAGTEFITILNASRGTNDDVTFTFSKCRIFAPTTSYDEAVILTVPIEIYGGPSSLTIVAEDQIASYD